VGWSCRRGWEEETSEAGWEVGILRVDIVVQGQNWSLIRSMVWKGGEASTMSLITDGGGGLGWFLTEREREEVGKLQELGNLVLWSKEA